MNGLQSKFFGGSGAKLPCKPPVVGNRAGHRRCVVSLIALMLGTSVLFTVLPALRPIEARTPKQHWGDGFSIDLDQPYDVVLRIVQATAGDGLVRGSSDYKGTSGLEGARIVFGLETPAPLHSDGGVGEGRIP